MPAKELSPEQKRDAERLKQTFKTWQSSRRDRGEPWQQEAVTELFAFGQSALSQYINGAIPLNPQALAKFASVLGVRPENISPSLVSAHGALTKSLRLASSNADVDTGAAVGGADQEELVAASRRRDENDRRKNR